MVGRLVCHRPEGSRFASSLLGMPTHAHCFSQPVASTTCQGRDSAGAPFDCRLTASRGLLYCFTNWIPAWHCHKKKSGKWSRVSLTRVEPAQHSKIRFYETP